MSVEAHDANAEPPWRAPSSRSWTLPVVCVACALLVLVAAVLLVAFLRNRSPVPQVPFSADEWWAHDGAYTDTSGVRLAMSDDLRDRLLRAGMSKPEVHGLRGAAPGDFTASTWGYDLGVARNRHYELLLEFDGAGALLETRVIRHEYQ